MGYVRRTSSAGVPISCDDPLLDLLQPYENCASSSPAYPPRPRPLGLQNAAAASLATTVKAPQPECRPRAHPLRGVAELASDRALAVSATPCRNDMETRSSVPAAAGASPRAGDTSIRLRRRARRCQPLLTRSTRARRAGARIRTLNSPPRSFRSDWDPAQSVESHAPRLRLLAQNPTPPRDAARRCSASSSSDRHGFV